MPAGPGGLAQPGPAGRAGRARTCSPHPRWHGLAVTAGLRPDGPLRSYLDRCLADGGRRGRRLCRWPRSSGPGSAGCWPRCGPATGRSSRTGTRPGGTGGPGPPRSGSAAGCAPARSGRWWPSGPRRWSAPAAGWSWRRTRPTCRWSARPGWPPARAGRRWSWTSGTRWSSGRWPGTRTGGWRRCAGSGRRRPRRRTPPADRWPRRSRRRSPGPGPTPAGRRGRWWRRWPRTSRTGSRSGCRSARTPGWPTCRAGSRSGCATCSAPTCRWCWSHDGTAAAQAVPPDPHAAVVLLGTSIGVGFPHACPDLGTP